MSLRNFIAEKIILPLSDLATGESSYKSFKFINETKDWTREQIDEFQDERLRLLIRYAVEHVPYYRDLFKSLGLTADDIQTKADLWKIPIVNKTIMRKEGIERFTAEGFPPEKRMLQRSGGSTGETFSYYVTKEESSVNLATKLRTWYNVGYRLGDKYVKIANAERSSFMKRMQDVMNNSVLIPFSNVSEEGLKNALDEIERIKPLYIRSYPMPLFLLAQYKKMHEGYHHSPKCIFTTGSTLSENYRNEIETAFGCKIIDSYSCEGNANVYQSPNCDCYHVSEEFGITEVLDNDNQMVVNGIGRVITTDLWNLAHPFIRYDTRDLVEVSEEPCSCGNPRKRIKRIMGRECESFLQADGKYVTVHDLTGFFKKFSHVNEAIEAYQLVKKKDGSVLFRLVTNPKFTDGMKQEIAGFWSTELKRNVAIEIVDEIPLMGNNKRLTIVDEK